MHLRVINIDRKAPMEDIVPALITAPIIQRIINEVEHTDTGCCAKEVIFGIHSDPTLYPSPNTPVVPPNNTDRYYNQLINLQIQLLQRSREYQAQHTDLYLLDNADKVQRVFQPGDYVLVKYPDNKVPVKKNPPVRGPYRTLSRNNDKYDLINLLDDSVKTFHSSELRLYNYSYYHDKNPYEVALLNSPNFEVDAILDHRGDIKRRGQLQFLVSFKGYGDHHNLWVTCNEICRHDLMPEYLQRFPHLTSIVNRYKHG
jgi:hypothetical protein